MTAGAARLQQYPQYGFAGHKGYGTAAHMAALPGHGASIYHRRSFAPVAKVLRPQKERRMTSSAVTLIQSRDNALVKDLQAWRKTPRLYRKQAGLAGG